MSHVSAEHVLARRRQGKLVLTRPTGLALQRLEQDAELLLRCYLEHRGQPRDKLRQALRELGAGASSLRAWSGLVKLCEDAAHYQTEPLLEPVDLRRAVFSRASAARRAGSGWSHAAAIPEAALRVRRRAPPPPASEGRPRQPSVTPLIAPKEAPMCGDRTMKPRTSQHG